MYALTGGMRNHEKKVIMSQNPMFIKPMIINPMGFINPIGVISSQTRLPNAFVYLTKENERSEVEWLFFKM